MVECAGPATVVFDQSLTEYSFGPSHPMSPVRVDLTMRLAAELGITGERLRLVPAPMADDDLLATVHEPAMIEAVARAGTTGAPELAHGLGTDDDPVFPDMHRAAAHVVGASVEAFRQVWSGESLHSANITGGLHHAMPDRASGFCIYNDVAVGIRQLLDQGAERVAYVDVDVHHGDGVEAIFWDDPRVLTISIHESPRTLFPGTGFPTETGGPSAPGTAVNIAVPAGTNDQGWLRALHGVVPDVLAAFAPQVLVSQHGVDTHFEDPLAHLLVSLDGQRMAFEAVHRWAHRYAGGRWVALGGGGYEWVDVVPRAWTHLIAEATGHPIDPQAEVPEAFREFVLESLGRQSPGRMTDGRQPWPRPFDQGFDPDDVIDAAVMATREAVYPHYGLTAEPSLWF
jgi:acetoin utilization protein AcuC